MSIPIKPMHGKIRFEWVLYPLPEGSSNCKGKQIKGMNVLYRPDAGYRGKDEVHIGLRYPMFEGSTSTSYSEDSFNITVK